MMTAMTTSNQNKRIHPHKFLLWVGIGSICMMFAGLTSAYIVKRSQSNWQEINMPVIFGYSTCVILISSVTAYLAVKAFKTREMGRYKIMITLTVLLGILFAYLQWAGFQNLANHGIRLLGSGSNAAASFLVVILGLHVLHVLGGVIALLVIFIRAYSRKIKNYSSVPIEVVSTYWHFVDILWIYLFIFLNFIK